MLALVNAELARICESVSPLVPWWATVLEQEREETMSKKKTGPKTISMKLPVKLTKEERDERTAELLAALQKEVDLVSEKSEAVAGFNASIKLQRQLVSEKRKVLEKGEEPRDVECVEVFDFRLQQVHVDRKDTGERVSTRAMSVDERQETLPGVDERDGSMTTSLGDALDAKADKAKKRSGKKAKK